MRERMDRMFDDSYNRFRRSPFFDEERIDSLLPQTDLLEEDDRYVVKMNIPGSEQAEIKVDIEGAILTVKTQTQHPEDQKKDRWPLENGKKRGYMAKNYAASRLDRLLAYGNRV